MAANRHDYSTKAQLRQLKERLKILQRMVEDNNRLNAMEEARFSEQLSAIQRTVERTRNALDANIKTERRKEAEIRQIRAILQNTKGELHRIGTAQGGLIRAAEELTKEGKRQQITSLLEFFASAGFSFFAVGVALLTARGSLPELSGGTASLYIWVGAGVSLISMFIRVLLLPVSWSYQERRGRNSASILLAAAVGMTLIAIGSTPGYPSRWFAIGPGIFLTLLSLVIWYIGYRKRSHCKLPKEGGSDKTEN